MILSKKFWYIFILILFTSAIAVGCGGKAVKDMPTVKTNFLLDTLVQITAYGPEASQAIDDAFGRIAEIQKKMTVNEEDSEVIRINKSAGKKSVVVGDDTFEVIERGLYYSTVSRGRFDITVGPLIKLWGIGTDKAKVPSQVEIEDTKSLVNYEDVLLDKQHSSVKLNRLSMGLDLGAIAKGYAADEVKKVLAQRGISSAAIDLGGNMLVMGTKPDGSPWKIGLQDPFKTRGNVFATVEVVDKTLVTSGTYERFFEVGEKRYHHILDPLTGYPVENGLASVTIITDRSIDADGLSTAVFASGLKDGMDLVEKTPGVSAVFVTNDRRIYISSGVSQYNIVVTDRSYKLEDSQEGYR